MGKTIHGLGGTARKKCDQWKTSTWVVKLKDEEIILPPSCKIKHQNNAVLKAKQINLEEELHVANKKIKDLSDRYATLEKSCNKLLKSIPLGEGASAMPGTTRKRKSWAEYTPQYCKKRIRLVANKVQAEVLFAKDDHFKATKIELTNEQTGDIVATDASGKTVTVKQVSSKGSSNDADQSLRVKEKFNISHEAHHEMARVNPEMP